VQQFLLVPQNTVAAQAALPASWLWCKSVATTKLLSDDAAGADALAVFNDIREKRGTDYVNNFWRALANDPPQLKSVWDRLQVVMAPGALDPLVKELIYIAVSSTNKCGYCIHSHTAAARAKGMTDAQYTELLQIIAMASQTNALVTAMQVEVDERFKV
jgi:AhpD family alkylhydroperoxidase